MKVLVVGAGLIGGSIALAAKNAGHTVWIRDAEEEMTDYAASVLGVEKFQNTTPELVVVAVPPLAVPAIINDLKRLTPNSIFIDVASVKNEVVVDVETVCGETRNYVPTHPMAGKADSGPEAASYDLFQNRVWVITPLESNEAGTVSKVTTFIESLGAITIQMSVEEHDALVARTSHTPQVLSTALAILTSSINDADLQVSGTALQDMTRIAASNPKLWADILIGNRWHVISALEEINDYITQLSKALKEQNSLLIEQFIDKGKEAKRRLPGKHGQPEQSFTIVAVQIEDRPGALADIFNLAAANQINIEDVRIDHALGRQIAIIEISVVDAVSAEFKQILRTAGWKIRFEN